MRTIATYPDLASAQIAQTLLEAEGIDALIPDENVAGINWMMSNALPGVRLQVAPEDADAAEALLLTEVPIADDVRCPECGSGDVAIEQSRRWFKGFTMLLVMFAPVAYSFLRPLLATAVLIFLLVAAFPISSTRHRRCSACGHRWRAEE